MAKIKEDYVSFEVAKLLKEKHFNEICRAAYTDNGKFITYHNYYSQYEDGCIAPTHQMTMKWLREVYNIFIIIEPHAYDYVNEKNKSYVCSLWMGDNYYENPLSRDYPTYEETVEAVIKYCLENLI